MVQSMHQGMKSRILLRETASSLLVLRDDRRRKVLMTKLEHGEFATSKIYRLTEATLGSKNIMDRVRYKPFFISIQSDLI